MTCSRCSTPNRTGANFCKQCGNLLISNCPRCRFDVDAGANFCDNCGLRLVETPGGWWPVAPYAAQASIAARVEPPAGALVPGAASQPRAPSISGAPPLTGPVPPAPRDSGAQLQQYVPAELLRRLETARAKGDMVGERRVVTMLFCDVKGSTAAAEQLDPEEWTEIMNGVFEHMIKPVYAYEGTVARLMGDALLAFFGAPLAHEDDPQRAVLAGLDIVAGIQPFRNEVMQKWGIEFNVRAGINTGLVVVGAVGSDLRVEYSALGDAINLAARMEQTATPGTVQIAHDTYRLVKPIFEFEELGGIEVKGKSEPVLAYRVLGRKATPGRARGIAGLESKLIGREPEMAALDAVLADARLGIGRVVCLLGEAGLGKSRLLAEARKRWKARESGAAAASPRPTSSGPAESGLSPKGNGVGPEKAEGWLHARPAEDDWFELSCVSYESTRPYGLMQDFLRRVIGIERAEQPAIARARLGALQALFPAERHASVARVLETLLGVPSDSNAPPLDGEAFKRELYEVIRAMWQKRFTGRPTVLVCDDMHWADAASVELLRRLLPAVADVPLVLLCSMRPDREAPAWQIKAEADAHLAHRYCELLLKPLPALAVRALLVDLLGGTMLPDELQDRILERAGGNPFFIEEVLRSIIDQGIIAREPDGPGWMITARAATLDIPDNLQALLTARIDRLEEQARRTVQLASVVGRSFYYKVLARLEADGATSTVELDRYLNALLRAEMIQEAARIPEVEYRFRNPLTQEIAYATILLKRRRELHRQAAEAIESLFPDRLPEHAARLGFHHAEAQNFPQAVKYFAMAGDAAFQLYAHTEALQHYRQALAIARPHAAGRASLAHLWLRIGRTLELQSQFEEAHAAYIEMEEYAVQHADRPLELAAVVAQGTLHSTVNPFFDRAHGEPLAERGLALARGLGDGAAEAKIYWNLLNLHRFTSRLPDAEDAGERSLAIARRLDLREQIAFTLNDMYYVHLSVGRLPQAMTSALEARALWRELDNRVMLADNLSSTIMSHLLAGNIDMAIADSNEAFEVSQSTGNGWGMAFSRMFIGNAYRPRGEFGRALDMLQAAMENADRSGFLAGQIFARAELGLVYTLLGQHSRGVQLVRAISDGPEYGTFNPLWVRAVLCYVYIAMGELDRAEETLRPALAEPKLDAFVEVNVARVWPTLLFAQGKNAEAAQLAAERVERLHLMGVRLLLPDILLVLGQARLALNELEAARAALQEAETEADAMGFRWTLWQIHATRADLECAAGNSAEGQRLRAQARAGIVQIAAELGDPELKASLLNRPVVRSVLEQEPLPL